MGLAGPGTRALGLRRLSQISICYSGLTDSVPRPPTSFANRGSAGLACACWAASLLTLQLRFPAFQPQYPPSAESLAPSDVVSLRDQRRTRLLGPERRPPRFLVLVQPLRLVPSALPIRPPWSPRRSVGPTSLCHPNPRRILRRSEFFLFIVRSQQTASLIRIKMAERFAGKRDS